MEIWFNPRCSKSRAALGILQGADVEVEQRRYLEDPPDAEELETVLEALGMDPWDIARTGEEQAAELGMDEWGTDDRRRWIDALVEHPILIERPIVIAEDGRAVLGRPPEVVRDLL